MLYWRSKCFDITHCVWGDLVPSCCTPRPTVFGDKKPFARCANTLCFGVDGARCAYVRLGFSGCVYPATRYRLNLLKPSEKALALSSKISVRVV